MKSSSIHGMMITDLDGTLLHSNGYFSPSNLATLEELGRRRILRIIATGRSLYSAYKVIPLSFPLDYLIFSSGAGILDWHSQQLLLAHHLSAQDIQQTLQVLIDRDIDFMLHKSIPENHYFWYHSSGRENPDFLQRFERYREFGLPWTSATAGLEKACQFVAIDPQRDTQSEYETIRQKLPMLKVIRTTSPLDGKSTWIEIFPASVSKAIAGAWLAERYDIEHAASAALGNDYNDLDMLQWAAMSFVVENAPDDLKAHYRCVCSNNENGFSEAVNLWIPTLHNL